MVGEQLMLIPYATFTEFLANHPKRSDEVQRLYNRTATLPNENEQETASGVEVVGISVLDELVPVETKERIA